VKLTTLALAANQEGELILATAPRHSDWGRSSTAAPGPRVPYKAPTYYGG